MVQENGRKLAFFRELEGKPHRAVVEATEKGELYLVSFHRVQRRNRRSKLVREGR